MSPDMATLSWQTQMKAMTVIIAEEIIRMSYKVKRVRVGIEYHKNATTELIWYIANNN